MGLRHGQDRAKMRRHPAVLEWGMAGRAGRAPRRGVPSGPDQASCLRRPNFLMREQSVVGLMPSRAAAPSSP